MTPLPPTTAHTALTLQSVGKNEAMLKALSTLNEFITASARTFQTFFSETQLVRALPCVVVHFHTTISPPRVCVQSALPHSERHPPTRVPWNDALQGPKVRPRPLTTDHDRVERMCITRRALTRECWT